MENWKWSIKHWKVGKFPFYNNTNLSQCTAIRLKISMDNKVSI